MEFFPLNFEGAWLAKSPVWSDNRGYFREWFKSSDVFSTTGIHFNVQQANISSSSRGVLRGIHYSLAIEGQAKWITCVRGAIRDVIVDIRPHSATYGLFQLVDLSADSGNAVFIGHGLGHGFISLSDESTVAYLVSSAFSPSEEFEINPLDPAIGIEWGIPLEDLLLSPKDATAPLLAERMAQGELPK